MFGEALMWSLIVLSEVVCLPLFCKPKRLTFSCTKNTHLSLWMELRIPLPALVMSLSHLYLNPAHIKLNLRFCASGSPLLSHPSKEQRSCSSTEYLLRLVRYNIQSHICLIQTKTLFFFFFFFLEGECCVSQIMHGTYLY